MGEEQKDGLQSGAGKKRPAADKSQNAARAEKRLRDTGIQSAARTGNLSAAKRKEQAKRRRQKALVRKAKAYGLLAAAVLVLVLIVVGLIQVISGIGSAGKNRETTPDAVNTVQTTAEAPAEGSTQEDGTGAETVEEATAAHEIPDTAPAETPAPEAAAHPVLYATTVLNVRSAPSIEGEVLGKLQQGEAVERLAEENGWSTILYNGANAYVSSDYLSPEAPAAQPGGDSSAENAGGSGWGNPVLETNPALSGGQWDLSTLSTESVFFGYAPENRDANHVPTDWAWYESKWGRFNVDWIQDPSKPVIYLTMDEGYGNDQTITILDTLKEKNVNCTFFLTKFFIDDRPELVQRMLDEGHQLGNHTCTHRDMSTLSVEEQTEEIMTVQNMVKEQFGYDMKLFRFPQGHYSDQCLGLVDNLGLKTAFWTNGYEDYVLEKQIPVPEMMEKVVNDLHPGAIYLLHARSDTNMTILGDFIDAARARGFEFGVYPLGPN